MSNYETMKKEHLAKNNWRAHVANYITLRKKKGKKYSPEKYCKEMGLAYEGFQVYLKFIEREDEVSFYCSLASLPLDRAKKSLDLLKKYIDTLELRMPLVRDAIVAYASLFRDNRGRTIRNGKNNKNTSFHLKKIVNIPAEFQQTHDKICEDRDTVVAHCDLGVRNPTVCIFGIGFRGAGYYWEDYKKLIPEFEKLISVVQQQLNEHNAQRDLFNKLIQDFEDHPACCLEDPGPPKVID